jgi:hypothetical protein
MLVTLRKGMGADKVKYPLVGAGKTPTLTTSVRMYHVATQRKLTLRWDHIPNSESANSTYYVHLVWTFFHLVLVKCFDLF